MNIWVLIQKFMNLFNMNSLQIALFIGCQDNIKDDIVNKYSNISQERITVDLFVCFMLYITVTVNFSVRFGRLPGLNQY